MKIPGNSGKIHETFQKFQTFSKNQTNPTKIPKIHNISENPYFQSYQVLNSSKVCRIQGDTPTSSNARQASLELRRGQECGLRRRTKPLTWEVWVWPCEGARRLQKNLRKTNKKQTKNNKTIAKYWFLYFSATFFLFSGAEICLIC